MAIFAATAVTPCFRAKTEADDFLLLENSGNTAAGRHGTATRERKNSPWHSVPGNGPSAVWRHISSFFDE